MHSSIITLDFLISFSNGDTFYFDGRYCPTSLLKEVILRGFQVCNLYQEDFFGTEQGAGDGDGEGGKWENFSHGYGGGSGYRNWGPFGNGEGWGRGCGIGCVGTLTFGEGSGWGTGFGEEEDDYNDGNESIDFDEEIKFSFHNPYCLR